MVAFDKTLSPCVWLGGLGHQVDTRQTGAKNARARAYYATELLCAPLGGTHGTPKRRTHRIDSVRSSFRALCESTLLFVDLARKLAPWSGGFSVRHTLMKLVDATTQRVADDSARTHNCGATLEQKWDHASIGDFPFRFPSLRWISKRAESGKN